MRILSNYLKGHERDEYALRDMAGLLNQIGRSDDFLPYYNTLLSVTGVPDPMYDGKIIVKLLNKGNAKAAMRKLKTVYSSKRIFCWIPQPGS